MAYNLSTKLIGIDKPVTVRERIENNDFERLYIVEDVNGNKVYWLDFITNGFTLTKSAYNKAVDILKRKNIGLDKIKYYKNGVLQENK